MFKGKQIYYIVISKKGAKYPKDFEKMNFLDYKDDFALFFEGELVSEEEFSSVFHKAIFKSMEINGRGEGFLPVLAFDEKGGFVTIEGSSNWSLVS